MSYNQKDPLVRMEGETRKANDALNLYYALGHGRSLTKLVEKLRESEARTRLPTVTRWSSKYKWGKRVDAQGEIDNAKDREYWAEARRQIRQDDMKAAVELRERAARMRAFPIAEQKIVEHYDDGRAKTVIIKPANWREADISRIETTASDLARRAADMKKESIGIDVTQVDWSQLTDEQLDRIISGASLSSVLGGKK